ncbi:hypothetical protein RJ640_018661 [Escallonia rubra]|uniref:Uncharacterized protein n=1 Tax=Escallonia rubra TaxID=112253 RepID=A0AA88R3H8_9ASTE|nr:hypothetical protein RJ640_018661 [Escallonia rubra]
MSGGFLRNGIRSHYSLWKRHSIADQIGAPTIRSHYPQQQSKAYARFPHSFYRKSKDLDLSLPSVPISPFSSTTSSSSASRIPLVGWYLGLIKTKPILTKSITSALIYTAADLSSQFALRWSAITSMFPFSGKYGFYRDSKLLDVGLTTALVLLDAKVSRDIIELNPDYHIFVVIVQLFLQTIASSEPYDLVRTLRMAGYGMMIVGPSLHLWFNFMAKVLPKRDLITTLKKIALGQTVYGPTLTVVFFSLNAGLQGENGAEIIARLKRDLLPTMTSGVMYWPFCDFVTFRFVPVHLQPLVSNSFSYLWSVYLTYMASLEKADTKALRSS